MMEWKEKRITETPGIVRNNKKKAAPPQLLAAILVVLLMGISLALIPVSLEINDDVGIMGYVSGDGTGELEADTIFSLFLWGKLLASLYTLTPRVPWYSISFLLLIAVSQWIFFAEVIRLTESAGKLWFGILCSAALYALLFLYYTARLQFTVVSAFCGIGALTLVLVRCREGRLRQLLPRELAVFLLTMFSVNIRSRSRFCCWGAEAFPAESNSSG